MRYLVGLICVLALSVMGCSEPDGTGGAGGSAGMGGSGGGVGGVGGDGGAAGGGIGGGGGSGGDGGSAGTGGVGGDGGTGGMPECQSSEDCADDGNECTKDGVCIPQVGVCRYLPVEDGTECGLEGLAGMCASGMCRGLCEGVGCEDNECRSGGACDPSDGACAYDVVADDGTPCSGGECLGGICGPVGAFPCTEDGVRDAIAEGGGPHFFACDGPTIVATEDTVVVDNDVILSGESELTLDGNAHHSVLSVAEGVKATLQGFRITGGLSPQGAGIRTRGTLTLIETSVSGNEGKWVCWGGSGYPPPECYEPSCVGIFVDGGSLILKDSTVANNGNRSAAYMTICTDPSTMMAIANSTISGNRGGIRNTGTATITSSTVTFNSYEMIRDVYAGGTLTIANSIIDGTCVLDVVSNGHNIESSGDTCGFDQPTDQVNVSADDLKLGPLQDNGGPTETHALGEGSVAIDQIPEAECVDADGAPLTTDQRGEPRDSMCDVGAFEVQP